MEGTKSFLQNCDSAQALGALRGGWGWGSGWGAVAEADFSPLAVSVWVTVVLREILRSHSGSAGKGVLDGLVTSVTVPEMKSGNAFSSVTLVSWNLHCGFLPICTKGNCTNFESVVLFSFIISQRVHHFTSTD